MRRPMIGVAALVLIAAACTAGGGEDQSPSPIASGSIDQTPVTIEMWTFLSQADGKALVEVVDPFHEQYPWITVEIVYDQYDRQIFNAIRGGNPPDVASLGFTGQLYTEHQLGIANKNKDFLPALAITQTYENVRQVVRGLSELNHNIRRYIERATRGRSPAELLQLQFDDYAQTLGHAYHALNTSDHVSRYRRDIIARLRTWERNADG